MTTSHAANCALMFGLESRIVQSASKISSYLSRFEMDLVLETTVTEEEEKELEEMTSMLKKAMEFDLEKEEWKALEVEDEEEEENRRRNQIGRREEFNLIRSFREAMGYDEDGRVEEEDEMVDGDSDFFEVDRDGVKTSTTREGEDEDSVLT